MEWIRVFSNTTIPKLVEAIHVKPSLCKVVPEGSYVNYYTNSTNREEARKRLKIEKDRKVLLYLGYIKPYKGISELLDEFQQSFQNEADTLLLIAGQVMDKNYFNSIKERAGKQVQIFDRFIEDDELQYFMHAADIVILPFKKIENSGSVILAMGFEKPVIAPKMGVLTERLKAQPNLLYQEHISESFSVLKSLSTVDLKDIGSQNARALELYHWKDFAKEFIQSC
jgi:glycosyltransferase involved in cell wall biosynthesis